MPKNPEKLCLTCSKVESGLLQIDPAHRWNFSQTFFEKSKQTSKQWHTTRKRTSQNSGSQKKKFKIVWEKFQRTPQPNGTVYTKKMNWLNRI